MTIIFYISLYLLIGWTIGSVVALFSKDDKWNSPPFMIYVFAWPLLIVGLIFGGIFEFINKYEDWLFEKRRERLKSKNNKDTYDNKENRIY